jgi:hypothetical protein
MTIIGPPQQGQSHAGGSSACAVSDFSDSEFVPVISRQMGSNIARQRFVMYPKKRMRTNPRGSV